MRWHFLPFSFPSSPLFNILNFEKRSRLASAFPLLNLFFILPRCRKVKRALSSFPFFPRSMSIRLVDLFPLPPPKKSRPSPFPSPGKSSPAANVLELRILTEAEQVFSPLAVTTQSAKFPPPPPPPSSSFPLGLARAKMRPQASRRLDPPPF